MLSEPVLVDTGPLIALYNRRDPYHQACVDQVNWLPVGKAFTCWPVIVEAAYLLRNHVADRDRLLAAVAAQEFVLLPLERTDVPNIQAVLNKYSDQGIDFADATLVHLSNRESISAVFTLDRRHFSVMRPTSGSAFCLLPETA